MASSGVLRTVIVAALAALSAITGMPSATAAPTALNPGEGFEETACPVEVPEADSDRVTCGYLTVPERRDADADPERTLQLPVAIIASKSSPASPDPVVFPTAGGPGAGSIAHLEQFLSWADWVGERDVILIEQRGDAYAEPSLDCPELDVERSFVDGVRVRDDDNTRYLAAVQACHDRLVEDGVDLSAYTSAASAADLADLRRVFGYDQWNLYGASYGTRLALTTMRDQPEGLRAVILDGTYPPNIDLYELAPEGLASAIDTVAAHCAADADCAERHPDLIDTLLEVLDTAAETPFQVTVKSPVDGTPVRLEIDDEDIAQGLFSALYDPNSVRVLPFVIDQVAQGNLDPLLPLAQQNLDFEDYATEGLSLSIQCAEELPFTDDAAIAAAIDAHPVTRHYDPLGAMREACEIWGVPPLAAIENEAVASDVPTLLVVGSYDPVTPHVMTDAAVAGLSHHFVFEFPTLGHGVVWSTWIDTCPASIAARFLNDPATAPNTVCQAEMPPTDFLTTADIDPTSAVYRLNSDVIQNGSPVQLALLGTLLAVLLVTLIWGIVYGLRPAARRSGRTPEGTMLTASVSAGLNLAFVAGLVLILWRTDPLILGFGLPAAAWPLLLLPFAALALTVLLVVLLVRAWLYDDGTVLRRVLLSIAAVAEIAFAIWLLTRGLLTL